MSFQRNQKRVETLHARLLSNFPDLEKVLSDNNDTDREDNNDIIVFSDVQERVQSVDSKSWIESEYDIHYINEIFLEMMKKITFDFLPRIEVFPLIIGNHISHEIATQLIDGLTNSGKISGEVHSKSFFKYNVKNGSEFKGISRIIINSLLYSFTNVTIEIRAGNIYNVSQSLPMLTVVVYLDLYNKNYNEEDLKSLEKFTEYINCVYKKHKRDWAPFLSRNTFFPSEEDTSDIINNNNNTHCSKDENEDEDMIVNS
jgi:hypothetical protein